MKRILVGIASVALVTVVGCDLFRPAVPESPIVPPCTADVSIDLRDPQVVLQTLKEAIEAKDCGNGDQAYVTSFADSTTDGVPFRATFADEVIALREQAGLPVPIWDLSLERAFYKKFVRLYDSGYEVTWSADPSQGDDINLETGNATLHRRYDVEKVEEGETQGSIAVGYADLTLRRITDTRWVIVQWGDRIDVEVGVNPPDPGLRSIGEWRLETQ